MFIFLIISDHFKLKIRLILPNILQICLILCKTRIYCWLQNSANLLLFGYGRIFCINVLHNIMPKTVSVGLYLELPAGVMRDGKEKIVRSA